MDFVLTHFRCPGVYSTIRRLKIENTWLFPLCQNQTLFLMAFLTKGVFCGFQGYLKEIQRDFQGKLNNNTSITQQ